MIRRPAVSGDRRSRSVSSPATKAGRVGSSYPEPVNDALAFAARIPSMRAEADPLDACIADSDTELSNAAFAADVARLAGRLAASGVGRGDTIAVMLPNCC